MSRTSIESQPSDLVLRGSARWEEYQRSHDVSHLKGQVAAIEPDSGRVWIGRDVIDVADRMTEDGVDVPAYFVMVGYDYLYVKGRR